MAYQKTTRKGAYVMRVTTSEVFPQCRVLVVIIAVLLLGMYGCSEDSGDARIEQPVLTSVRPTLGHMGDTLVVSGHGFNATPSMNRLAISPCEFSEPLCSRYSVPISGSDTHLVALVPDGAMTGSLRVEDIDPLAGSPFYRVKIPPLPSNTLAFYSEFRTGDVGKTFFSRAEFEFRIDAHSGNEDYLLIVFNSVSPVSDSWTYWYALSLNYTIPLAAHREPYSAGRIEPSRGEHTHLATYSELASDFKRRMREEVKELLEMASSGWTPRYPPIPGSDNGLSKQPALGEPLQSAQFKVLVDPTGSVTDPSNFTVITANLKYEGSHSLFYVDQATPPDNLTDTEAQNLGVTFDQQIYQKNHTYFGVESDINGDGKVAILLTPRVNQLSNYGVGDGIIVGYFMPTDLLPRYVDPRVTNSMEVFYSIVPDPDGDFGTAIPKEWALEVIQEVLAHEFQHMIMFNYRVLIYGEGYRADYLEELWLEEGLSHIAEDLNGYERSNVERANLFFLDPSSAYLLFKDEDNLDKRGAAFLFLRLIGDRYGNGIYKKLVQSMSAGPANVENATQENFMELFADWIAACYLSGRGITGDERFNYTSIDLIVDFKPLRVIEIPQWSEISGYVEAMSPEYILLHVPSGNSAVLSMSSDASGRMNAIVVRID